MTEDTGPMIITGLFDLTGRLAKLEQSGDPLVFIDAAVPWERFRPLLEQARTPEERKSPAGRKPWDAVVLFKMLVIQSLYNLSDDQTEYQVNDRLSFNRFVGLDMGRFAPDAKTIWLFREQLKNAGVIDKLFERLDASMRECGFDARKGQIVDASIVQTPRQRNPRQENEQIKNGQTPEDWSENKRRQKDTDARWLKRNGQNFYGYKNHISIDVKHKLIRRFHVTDAATHEGQVFAPLLDPNNTSRDVWADSAYRTPENLQALTKNQYREHIQRKGCRHKSLTEREKQGNRTRSKTRSRVEHIFGVQARRAGTLLLYGIGLARARVRIGLRNLAYNLDRYATLMRQKLKHGATPHALAAAAPSG